MTTQHLTITLHLDPTEYAALQAEAKDAGAGSVEKFTADLVADLLQERRAQMVAETREAPRHTGTLCQEWIPHTQEPTQ